MRIKYVITCRHLANCKCMGMLAAVIVHSSKAFCTLAGPAFWDGGGYVRGLVEVKVLLITGSDSIPSPVTVATL